MRLSIIVVTFNSAACIVECLDSLHRSLPKAEVIVVDNGSHDGTGGLLAARSTERVLQSTENLGFARACNMGADAALGTHLLFINPDVVVREADHDRLRRLADRSPFGLVAPVLIRKDRGRQRIEGGRTESHWLRDYVSNTWLALWPREFPLPGSRSKHGHPADWVSAAMLLAKTSEFRRLGGFDSRFFLYYEDRDLCARYRKEGLPILTTAALAAVHVGSSSSPREDLGVDALTWSLLGWLEYVFLHEGEETARRAARATISTLRLMNGTLRLARRGSLTLRRLDRKGDQIADVLVSLRQKAETTDSSPYCPDARRVLAEAWGKRLWTA
jgi:N-acetylglucosaminyl-diphospho-decaprenol L-rhamnosyltransferase